jgi:hypothetical protein
VTLFYGNAYSAAMGQFRQQKIKFFRGNFKLPTGNTFSNQNNQIQTSHSILPYPEQFPNYSLAVISFDCAPDNFFTYNGRQSRNLKSIRLNKNTEKLRAYLALKIKNG